MFIERILPPFSQKLLHHGIDEEEREIQGAQKAKRE
jgi:hypothetical protein